MRILFTKTGIEKEVSIALSPVFSIDFIEVIKLNFKTVPNLDLENKTLIFTSKNGAKGFLFNGLIFKKKQKIIVVGSKTKHLVEENNGCVACCEINAENIARKLENLTEKETFLHFCGNLSLNILENHLKNYRKIEVYETELLFPKIKEKYEAVVFFSPSGVRSFAKNNSLEEILLFSMGETTSQEIRKHTNSDIFTSTENNLEHVVTLINHQLKN